MRMIRFVAPILLACAAPSQAALVVNGDFELNVSTPSPPIGWTVAPGSEILAIKGAQYIPCCAVTGSAASLANTFASFGSGNVVNQSFLTQDVSTLANVFYRLSFDFGALGFGGSQTLTAQVFDVGTNALLGSLAPSATPNNNLDTTFASYTFGFTAASNATRLSFTAVPSQTTNIDGILDNVSLAAVPEPQSWAMMLIGFMVAGSALRSARRRRPRPAIA